MPFIMPPGSSTWPEDARNALADVVAAAEEMRTDLENAERELRRVRRDNTRMHNELANQRTQSSHHDDVVRIFDHWVAMCHKNPKRVMLTADREKLILQRIRDGYDVDFIMRAVDGFGRHHYVNDRGEHFNDLKTLLKDAGRLERYERLAERDRKKEAGTNA